MTILIGDKEIRANNLTHSNIATMKDHYPSNWFGSNTAYYYAPNGEEKSLWKDNKSVNYWTQDLSNDPYGYILFVGYDNAKAYFDNIGYISCLS